MCMVLHSADVSHPTKCWALHREWTARCMEEFFNQGDREKEMGLDVSPLCDRNTTQVPQSQIGEWRHVVVVSNVREISLLDMTHDLISPRRFHQLHREPAVRGVQRRDQPRAGQGPRHLQPPLAADHGGQQGGLAGEGDDADPRLKNNL